MKIIFSLILNALAIWVTAYLLPGVTITTWQALLVATIVLGALNTFVRPIIRLFSLPITLITLGIFNLVINGFIIILAAWLVSGFEVDNFLWAIAFSIVLSIVSTVLGWFGREK